MTSARNRPPLLSGSKIVLLASILLVTSSCGIFNKGKIDNKGDNVLIKDAITKVDTLTFNKLPDGEFPPITKEEPTTVEVDNFDAFKKDVYNIGMLIPFAANEVDMGGNDSQENVDLKYVNYYAGVKLALEDLREEGVNLNVTVFDSERSAENVNEKIINGQLQDMDVIIGPYNRDGLISVAEYGKENKIAVFSPWLASTRITDENPFYVQLRPSLSSHYFKIIEHVSQNFEQDEILLLGRDLKSDKNRFRYFQRTFAALQNSADPLEEFLVSEDSLSYGDLAFDDLFIEGGKKAVIIPNWDYKDEDFIYACLRRLNVEKNLTDVVVYGMPIIYDSDKMDFDYYRNLNIRICLSEFVDWNDLEVKKFKRKYFQTYADLPTSAAFEGFDITKFIANNIVKYGINFQLYLEEDRDRYLQTAYDIQKVYNADDEKFENLKYLENKHLDLIQYIGNAFEKIN